MQSRLEPEKVTFAPLDAMSPTEQQTLGAYAGQQVTTGPQAEAFARYIAGHLAEVNDGKTYAETSGAARAEGLDPKVAADLSAKADILFKGETLRSIMLNAYGWWTVATIALYVGYAMIALGILLGVLSILGFRHAKRTVPTLPSVPTPTTASCRSGHRSRTHSYGITDRPGHPGGRSMPGDLLG